MMARQLLDRELTISLPAYYGVTKKLADGASRMGSVSFLVTEPREITLKMFVLTGLFKM